MLMTLPKWNDPKLRAGTMIRTALWLTSEVGVGNAFTKEQHRQAFAGITQADRRLRDLAHNKHGQEGSGTCAPAAATRSTISA